MADTDDALRAVMTEWIVRRDAREAAFRNIRFGEKGDFQRAVDAVTPMLMQAIACQPKDGQVGRSLLEVLPMQFLSDPSAITNEIVQELALKAKTDFYSYQLLEYWALNPVFLQHLPALRSWQTQIYLGINQPPQRPKGLHKVANYYRDRAICESLRLLKKAGFKYTRNNVQVQQSACDVVAHALRRCDHEPITYSAVAKVWKHRDKLKPSAGGTDFAHAFADRLLAQWDMKPK